MSFWHSLVNHINIVFKQEKLSYTSKSKIFYQANLTWFWITVIFMVGHILSEYINFINIQFKLIYYDEYLCVKINNIYLNHIYNILKTMRK